MRIRAEVRRFDAMSYGRRLVLAAAGLIVLSGAVGLLIWGLSGPHVPKNAGRCHGPDPFIAYWRRSVPGLAYADGDGLERKVRPMVVSTSEKCVEAHCRDGVWDGEWRRLRRDGSVMLTGNFQRGLRMGEWRRLAPDGGLLGSVSLNEGSGHWKDWHDNGQLAEDGDYVEGEQSGVWRAWDADGGLVEEAAYARGLRDGETRWHQPDGGVRTEWYVFGRRADAGTPHPRFVPRLIPSEEVPGCGP